MPPPSRGQACLAFALPICMPTLLTALYLPKIHARVSQGFTMDQLRYLREFLKNPPRKGDKFLGEVLQTILDGEYA